MTTKRGGVSLGRMLLVNPSYEYVKMYRNMGFTGTDDINEADVVAFTGGEDVNPELYGEMKLTRTHINRERDAYEKTVFDAAVARGIPMIGICRGGQFLNVMNGGAMWQDVDHHGRNHAAYVNKTACPWFRKNKAFGAGNDIFVSSTHHQMMIPTAEAQILLTAVESTERLSAGTLSEGKPTLAMPITAQDIEAVWYPKTMSLCFQPHPEFNHCPPSGLDFFTQCVDNLILEAMPLPEGIRKILEQGVTK